MADPLSILGAAIGVTSLVVQLTEDCVKVFRLYKEAAYMDESCRYIHVRMQIEQQRFVNFCLEAGTVSEHGKIAESLRTNRSLLVAVLAEIKTLFEDYAKAYGKYEPLAPGARSDTDDPAEEENALLDLLKYDPSAKDETTKGSMRPKKDRYHSVKFFERLKDSGRKLKKIRRVPQQLTWTLMDRESFESLISKLEDLNSILIDQLNNAQTRRLQEVMGWTYQGVLQVQNEIESLRNLVIALRLPVEENSISAGEENTHRKEMAYLQKLAEIKIVYTQTTQLGENSDLAKMYLPATELDVKNFHFGDNFSPTVAEEVPRMDARYQDHNVHHNVWIEWKNAEAVDHMEQNTKLRTSLLTHLLLSEKPAGFCAPPCLGFVEVATAPGPSSFGIVFEKPRDTAMKMQTLQDIINTPAKPSLTARINLCAILARCISSFHAVNWLHKGLRPDNILFFRLPGDESNLGNPYVSGFELSRPSMLDSLTQSPEKDAAKDVYRHPYAQSSRRDGHYRKSYDLYSLGIVLLEIALWRPLHLLADFEKSIEALKVSKAKKLLEAKKVSEAKKGSEAKKVSEAEKISEPNPAMLLNIQPWLLSQKQPYLSSALDTTGTPCLEQVIVECGDTVRDVIHRCLTADEVDVPRDADESESSIGFRLQVFMDEQIVRKLEALAHAI